MAENVVDQVIARLRSSLSEHYPDRGPCKAVRLVGHTPKPEHYTYDLVGEFAHGSERISCKVYRGKSAKDTPKSLASREIANMTFAYDASIANKIGGIPRPLDDFSDLGAVVSEKVPGVPLQSIIMKAALLPGYADFKVLNESAVNAGEWLQRFHKATESGSIVVDSGKLLSDLEAVCALCKSEGLETNEIQQIVNGARQMLTKAKKSSPAVASVNAYNPLNIAISDDAIFVCDLSKMLRADMPYHDIAYFMAAVEALEKYPFCNREITSTLQENFLQAYGINPAERAIVRVLKMQTLLSMFAAGREGKQTAIRKKVMWANVMKKFIHEAATRTLSSTSNAA